MYAHFCVKCFFFKEHICVLHPGNSIHFPHWQLVLPLSFLVVCTGIKNGGVGLEGGTVGLC